MKCRRSTSAFQENLKKCTTLDDPVKKINPNWGILSNQQPVIITRYLIKEVQEEFVGEVRDVAALVIKTEKYPLCNQNINNLK